MPLSAFRMTQGIDSEVQWSSSATSSRVMARWAGTPEAQLLLPSTGGGGRVWGGRGVVCVWGVRAHSSELGSTGFSPGVDDGWA